MTDWVKQQLSDAFPEASIHLEGDGCHFKVVLYSDELASLPKVRQHRAVYKAIGDDVGKSIHALSIEVYPQQAL